MLKTALLTLSLLTILGPIAEARVIYGQDNRKDVFETASALHKRLASSTAGMVYLGQFDLREPLQNNLVNLLSYTTLSSSQNICRTEAFANQPLAPSCSGFLVAPDLIMTAGHCYIMQGNKEKNCKENVWVFDYALTAPNTNPSRNLSLANIYACKEVVAVQMTDTVDYALIRLNRPVTGRTPLTLRNSGKVSNNTELVVIGHPSGLPTKISDKARITDNSQPSTFATTLDTFHGNSGSVVFDAKTGLVEGILIQGKTDYVPKDPRDPLSCMVVNRCDENAENCLTPKSDNAAPTGEVVYRILSLSDLVRSASRTK